MLARLLQIRTFARTIKRDLALLSTTLRTNAPMHCRTETFFFANLTNRATQIDFPLSFIMSLRAADTMS